MSYRLRWSLPGADTLHCEYQCRTLELALRHFWRLASHGLEVVLLESHTGRRVASRR